MEREKISNVIADLRALPSGSWLTYDKPRVGVNRFGGESVTYMGTESAKKCGKIENYGRTLDWMPMLLLRVDGYECSFLKRSELYVVRDEKLFSYWYNLCKKKVHVR